MHLPAITTKTHFDWYPKYANSGNCSVMFIKDKGWNVLLMMVA